MAHPENKQTVVWTYARAPRLVSFAVLALLLPLPAAMATPADTSPEERWIVAFDASHHVPAVGEDVAGLAVAENHAANGFAVFKGTAADAERARHAPHVRYVERDVELHSLTMVPNDPLWTRTDQYAARQIGADDVWSTTTGSPDVEMCIVDSGIRPTHEDLQANYVGGRDFVTGLSQPIDDMGHGTNVAGAAIATTNNSLGIAGVAQVGLRVAKVMSASGTSSGSALTDAIRWCTDSGSDVISISLGTTGYSQLLFDTIEYAWSHGVVLVASAGNAGPCSDCIEYPAKFDHVLAVGCFVSWNDRCVASSSGPELDLMAPGDKLLTADYATDNGYVVRSGTSMSAPIAGAAAALLKSVNPSLTNTQIVELLRSTAQDFGAAGPDASYGHGLLRVDLAAASAGNPAPPPAQADLIVASTEVQPSSPMAGQVVYANATITNAGAAVAAAFQVHLKVDGTVVSVRSVDGLAAGASTVVSLPWNSTAGSHGWQVVADSGQQVAESSEADNAQGGSITVQSPPPAPVARGVQLGADQSGKARAQKPVKYTLTVKNTGDAADRVLLSLGTVPVGWQASLSVSSLDLAAGQTSTVIVTVTPGKLPRGATMSLDVVGSSSADASAQDAARLTTTVA